MDYARQGIPFRPDPTARREDTLLSISKAVLSLVRNQGDQRKAMRVLDEVGELLTRAAVTPTTLANAPGLAQLTYRFVEALKPTSASAAVIAQSLQLSFDGAAQISVPGLSIPAAAWVGEGAPIPVQNGTSSATAQLTPFKLAVIVALSNEMLIHSNAEAMIKMVLLENLGPTLDSVMFSNTAGVAGKSPPGLLYNISPITASTSTGIDALVADIGAITNALAPLAGGSPPVLVAAPSQFVSLQMHPVSTVWDTYMTTSLPNGTCVGVVPAALATAVEAPRIEMVDMAQLHMEQTALELVSSPGTVAAPQRSLFQTDSQAIRFILPASWAMRSASAVAVVNSVKW
jgi:hypothetical protein